MVKKHKDYYVMTKVTSSIVKSDYNKLAFHSEASGMPKARLIAIALHKELNREKPFKLPIETPDTFYEEFKYADQAGKILEFLRLQDVGLGLDMLYMLREEIGIKSDEELIEAWRELIEQDVLVKSKPNRKCYPNVPDDYYYTVRGNDVKGKKQARKQASEFARYQRLKAKYKREE